jgi:hypothetical protein
VLKLKPMLKISLGRGRNMDAHMGFSFLTLVFVAVGLDVAPTVIILFDLGALGIVDSCGTSSRRKSRSKFSSGLCATNLSWEALGLLGSGAARTPPFF